MENENTNVNTNENQQMTPPAQQQSTHPAQDQTVNLGLRTFTQEQLDAIIARERNKATKGWFTSEQMQAKDASISALTTERDNERAKNSKLQEELNGYKNEKFLASKGVPADMIEFYAFKIGKLVDDNKTFEQAAEAFLKDNPPQTTVHMSTGGGVSNSNGKAPETANEAMNRLLRRI